MFDSVGKQKDMAGWEPSLPAGHHRVALVRYAPKESQTDDGAVGLEGEFIILDTDNPKVRIGALHSWYWNINGTGKFTKQYAQDRAKKFLIEVAASIGSDAVDDPETMIGPFGADLAESFEASERPEMYGLELDVDVTPVFQKDGVTPVTYKRGGQVHNADWSAVAGQDEVTLAATCERLEELAKRPKSPAATAPTAAAATNAVARDRAPATGTAPPPAGAGTAPKARSLLGKRS